MYNVLNLGVLDPEAFRSPRLSAVPAVIGNVIPGAVVKSRVNMNVYLHALIPDNSVILLNRRFSVNRRVVCALTREHESSAPNLEGLYFARFTD